MPKSKHSEAAIIAALQQLDAGRKAAEAAREAGVSTYTIYALESQVREAWTSARRRKHGNCGKRMRV
jgi:hypothetical protein